MSSVHVGELRKSQAVHTFGIGATIDLPHFTVVGLGTDFWKQQGWDPTTPANAVQDERLLGLVQTLLGPTVRQLSLPPTKPDKDTADPFGMPVATFPTWGRCPGCELIAPFDQGHFTLDSPPNRPDAVKYKHKCRNKVTGREFRWSVNPVRFVVACTNGHLEDFPWEAYIRGASKNPCTCTPCGPLRLQEQGVSAEVANLWLKCDGCGAIRSMTDAFERNDVTQAYDAIGACRGHHPHFGRAHTSACSDAILRPMLLGASNQWFPLIVSALTLPSHAGHLASLVESNWPSLERVTNLDRLEMVLERGDVQELSGYEADEIFAAITEKRESGSAGGAERAEDLKIEEWGFLSQPESSVPTNDFNLRTVPVPAPYTDLIDSLVQVRRLRMVKALTGFTRIDSPGDYSDIADIEPAKRVKLSDAALDWVPAFEVRGEGIFIRLREDAINSWRNDPSVKKREAKLRKAHIEFRKVRGIDPHDDGADVLRFALLHSLSHALIRQFSIECGYSSASIQERIYSMHADHESGAGPMAGVLLMTAAPDSEGTLGGLVALGETDQFKRHLDSALGRATLCASDPLCSEHEIKPDGQTLHGAACHACMFVSETSCERGNRLIDRALLSPTTERSVKPFFPGDFK